MNPGLPSGVFLFLSTLHAAWGDQLSLILGDFALNLPRNVDIALDIDRYDFAVRVEFENGRPIARMERPA